MGKLIQVLAFIALVLPCCLSVVIKPRSSWGAVAPGSPSRLNGSVEYVIIHHSNTPKGCSKESDCQRLIKTIQTQHKTSRQSGDIGFNFIIGGDGNVYEGRGWGIKGAHAPKYDGNSIGIVFLGNFEKAKPSAKMLQNAKDLIAQGVSGNRLKANYTLLGHRQTKATSCPGTQLFNEIKTWPRWKKI